MKVLVVDDNAELRELVTQLLGVRPGVTWVGAAEDGFDAVVKSEEVQPDVVILDLEMPVMDGFQALPRILGVSPRSRVVVYSAQPAARVWDDLAANGACAYFEKTGSIRDLVSGVLDLGPVPELD